MTIKLKQSERRLYHYIRDYIDRNGVSPTTREMKLAMGYGSNATVTSIKQRLMQKGWLSFSRYGSRALAVARRDERYGRFMTVQETDLNIECLSAENVSVIYADMNGAGEFTAVEIVTMPEGNE